MNVEDWKTWEKKHRKQIAASVIILALALVFISVFNLKHNGYIGTASPVDQLPIEEIIPSFFRHPLTGALTDREIDRPAVYTVMVENSSDAWPQAGVDQAFFVIEAPAEGGIPRFETFFGADQNVEKIGPVRSARPYFIDFASAYGALYAHVGGSNAALAQLSTTNDVLNFDEYYNQYQFWRAADRLAPHNVFTSTELLAKGLNMRYPDEPVAAYDLWEFKDDVKLDDRPGAVSDTAIDFGASVYRVTWKYNRDENTYHRFENTEVHKMENGIELVAHTIAIIETDMHVLDAVGRLSVRTTGEGNGLFLQDGLLKEITWKREAITNLPRFYDHDGNELKMNAGQTWIEVVQSLQQVD